MINLHDWCSKNLQLNFIDSEFRQIYFKSNKPVPCSVNQFTTDESWIDFKNNLLSFKQCQIGTSSENIFPLTFQDSLYKHKFWEKLYYCAGKNLVVYLFNETDLYYKVNNGPYLALLTCCKVGGKEFRNVHFTKYKSALMSQGLGYENHFPIPKYKMLYRTRYWRKENDLITLKTANEVMNAICKISVGQEIAPYERDQIELFKFKKYLKQLLNKAPTYGECNKILRQYVDVNAFITSKRQIIIFIQKILHEYIPHKIFGPKKCFKKLVNNIGPIVNYTSKQTVTLAHITKGVKLSKFLWKRNLLAKTIIWIIEIFVFNLITAFFYVSESSQGFDLLFIRTSLWLDFQREAMQEMISLEQIEPCDTKMHLDKICKMRFLPKITGSGYRPLLKRSTSDRRIRAKYEICNTFLKQLIATKKGSYPKIIHDLHQDWINFVKLKINHQKCYFVKTDIRDAYGSIKHDILKMILEDYFNGIESTLKLLTFSYPSPWGGKKILKQFAGLKLCTGSKVLTYENGNDSMISLDELKQCIFSYIEDFYVKLAASKETYHFVKGIPQGGKLSAVLCEIYYSRLDMEHLSFICHPKQGDIMLRAIDDYIFISKDKDRTLQFLIKMLNGFSDYGVVIQMEKTFSNITPVSDSSKYTVSSDSVVPFFGYYLDLIKGYITPNMDTYGTTAFASRITFTNLSKSLLESRMSLTSTLKLQPLLLDSNYLTKRIFFYNIYNACCVLALRFYYIVSYMSYLDYNLENDFLLECIRKGIISVTKVSFKRGFPLGKFNSIKKICIKAFIRVLENKKDFLNIVNELRLYSSRLKINPKRDDKLLKLISKHLPAPLLQGCRLSKLSLL